GGDRGLLFGAGGDAGSWRGRLAAAVAGVAGGGGVVAAAGCWRGGGVVSDVLVAAGGAGGHGAGASSGVGPARRGDHRRGGVGVDRRRVGAGSGGFSG